MMTDLTFVSVKFREADTRTYTYTSDIPVNIGDRVLVDVRGEEKVVYVVEADVEKPGYACKPIIGMAPAKEEPANE
jgi:hypothetical protein